MAESKQVQNSNTKEKTDDEATHEQSDRVIKHHTLAAMGVGLAPIPILDLAGVASVQLNMLRKLAKLYKVPFLEHKVKSILACLVGGGGSVPLAGALASMVKIIPVVGSSIGAVSMPVSAGGATYAVGKVFQQHFASGGTFLTFKPEKVKAYYNKMLGKGKTVATGLKA